MIRETELQGGSLSVSNTREHLIYTAQFFREDASYFIKLLAQAATKGKYHHYTFGEVNKQVAFESSAASLEAHLLDQAHQVAFRNGLGNPVLAQPTNRVTVDAIESFAQAAIGADSTLLVANNVDADLLASEASEQFEGVPTAASVASSASQYFGGESRQAIAGPVSHVAVAFEGASLSSNEYTTFQVLRQILGGSKYVKWGNGSSALSQVAQSNGSQASAEAFNFGYSDAGLFGLVLSAPHTQISALTQSALSEVSKLGSQVSEEALKRAVSQAKFEILSASENQLAFNHQIGLQFVPQGAQVSDVVSQLNNVSAADVQKVIFNI
jgi:ubiquinol-cytochrome c reductase core subunit 2